VSYDYDVSVAGMVASVGNRMLDGAARPFIAGLVKRLGRDAQAGRRPSAGRRWLPWG